MRGDLGASALATMLASEQEDAESQVSSCSQRVHTGQSSWQETQQMAAAGLQKLGEVGARGATEMLSHKSPAVGVPELIGFFTVYDAVSALDRVDQGPASCC